MTEKLPPGWKISPLVDVATLIMGQSPESKYYNISGDGLPFFQGKAEFGELYPVVRQYCSAPKKVVKASDILLSVRAPVGPTNLAKEDSCIGRGLAGIRPTKDLDNQFLLYQFRNLEPWLAQQGTGSTFQAINKSFLEKIEILVPGLAEQKRIVARLDRLLARVDSCRAHLDRAAAAIKRFRQSVLNNLINPSDSCKRVNLSDVCKSIADGDHQAPPKSETGIPFLVISNLMSGKVDLQSVTRYVPETYYNSLNVNRSPQKNDILYTVTGSYGKAVLVENDAKFCFQRHIAILKPDPAKVDHTFLLYQLNSPQILNQANETATGVAQLTVPLKKLREFKVELPSLKEQKLIARKISTLFDYADQFESRLTAARQRVDNLTASILAKAFRGELVAASSVTKKKTETSAAF